MFWGGIFYDEYGNMQGVRASSLWREKEMNKLHGLCSIWCTRDMLMCAEGNGPSLRVGGRIRCVQYHVPRKKKDAGEQACSLLWPQPFRHPLSTDHPPARSTFANVKDARAETSWGHTSPRANSTERVPGESKNGSDFHPNSKIIMRRQDDGANDREIPQILVLLIQDNKTSRGAMYRAVPLASPNSQQSCWAGGPSGLHSLRDVSAGLGTGADRNHLALPFLEEIIACVRPHARRPEDNARRGGKDTKSEETQDRERLLDREQGEAMKKRVWGEPRGKMVSTAARSGGTQGKTFRVTRKAAPFGTRNANAIAPDARKKLGFGLPIYRIIFGVFVPSFFTTTKNDVGFIRGWE